MRNNISGVVLTRKEAEQIIKYESKFADGLDEEGRAAGLKLAQPYFRDLVLHSNCTESSRKTISIHKSDIRRIYYFNYDKVPDVIPSCAIIYTDDGLCFPIRMFE